jgi:trehalose/maltose transport system substrate-binding protein
MKAYPGPLRKSVIQLFWLTLLAYLVIPQLFGAGVTVRIAGYSSGEAGRYSRALADDWAQKTGNKVEYISRPADASRTLQVYQQYWAAKSRDVDVYEIDAVWQGIAAPHAVDLKNYYKEDELKLYYPRMIENNTVGGQLVSMPVYADAGILYYRTDLLKKYGYEKPPQTWEELATMAKKIQDGERAAGKRDFQGFVFQGKPNEGLTCNALEWIYSYGGGAVIEEDKRVTINNPNAIKALDTAHSWVGTISPQGVSTYAVEEARNIWQSGNAAFMRNWPYAYALGADSRSAISGKFDVTILPKGGENGKNAACMGGWPLMISAYSRVADADADLVRYLSSAEAQKKRAIAFGVLPTRPALYSDPEVLAKNPYFKIMPEVFENGVARPSTVTGADYNQLSTSLFENVNEVLTGDKSAQDAVSRVEKVAKRLMR